MRIFPVLLVALALRCGAGPALEMWHSGAAVDTRVEAQAVLPSLLLAGGGGDVDEAFRWFSKRCGGGDVVVLRVRGGDGYQDYLYREIGGFASVTTLALREASAASDPAVLQRVREAEGVFLAGGDQARYICDWLESPLGAVLQAHVDAGKPIGGTSAGLAVLGQFSFHALHDTITSEEALANPNDCRVALGRGLVQLPLMRGVLTDSHFMARERTGRLAVFLARLAEAGAPGARGLGVDEATAVCVDEQGRGIVISGAGGAAWVLALGQDSRCRAGEPFSGTARVARVPRGGKIRFPSLEVESGVESSTVTWKNGQRVIVGVSDK
ncbi:cyanophycinase [Nibricoccus sp. IMCC34717]|uniref:cyanophycinase n=1 Tax=Nibricoccus sp. IMCC34717 TaxID=3034021 RepID=UPI00384F28FB